MYLINIVPLTKIPHTQPQVLSYFFGEPLPSGTLAIVPLGKRKEKAVVLDWHEVDDFKMEIKKAGYQLRPLGKIISHQPILTTKQIKLALWLADYYFVSPGLFLKMMLPKKQSTVNSQQSTVKIQKLILAPVISRVQKITAEYPNSAVWHSGLTKKQQNEIWWKVKNGEAQTIVGTRSAIFLPFANLKEIIIEDETNSAHRSWDMWPRYRTHEAAKKLTEIFKAKLTIKDGTPSVDSFFSFAKNQFESRFKNPCYPERSEGPNGLPQTQIIDLRTELKAGNFSIFSRALQESIKNSLTQKGQIILFINRRGAATSVLCRDCGYTAKCQNCDTPLAQHLFNQKPTLLCHRCGWREKPSSLCPKCQSWRIKTVGVGTQKVETEAKKIFPQARALRLDGDSAPTAKEQQKIIETFAKKEIDILVATQIIFSWLEQLQNAPPQVIALISADTLLHLPDFRSGERTFQTITALKNLLYAPPFAKGGLGGILNLPQFFIQTYNPENSVIKYAAAGDWQSFYQEEIETRQTLGYPPFSQIVKLTFRHRDPKKAGQEAKILAAKLKQAIGSPSFLKEGGGGFKIPLNPPFSKGERNIEISDALPAFISKEKGKYIWNIIIKFSFSSPPFNKGGLGGIYATPDFLQSRNSLLQYVPSSWEIDVDPSDLL